MSYPPPVSAAPNYDRPPRKNRAGLIIVLLVVLLIGVLGVGGVLTYRLISDKLHNSAAPSPGTSAAPPVSSPTPEPSVPAPRPTKTVQPRPAKTAVPPTTKLPAPTRPGSAAELARRFVAQLNANNPTAAAAYACQDSKQLIPILMGQYLQPPTKLTPGTSIGGQPTYAVRLTGTTKGSPVTGVIIIQQLTPEPLCVRIFSITGTS